MNTFTAEKNRKPLNGYIFLILMLVLVAVAIYLMTEKTYEVVGIISWVVFVLVAKGLMAIPPNTAQVFVLFGSYRGTARDSGFWWVNPFYKRQTVSVRARNFES